jgi:beta-xylosidase
VAPERAALSAHAKSRQTSVVSWPEPGQVETASVGCAPDIRSIEGFFYLCVLSNQKDGDFCRTEDPLTKPFERIAGSFRFWDPDLFRDDGGRLYLYWVSSNHEPIYGVELDPDTMQPVCEKQGLIFPDSVGVRTCCACA